MEVVNKPHIKKTTYIITFNPKIMDKAIKFTKAQMHYHASIDDIANKIKACTICPRAKDKRLDYCSDLYSIDEVLMENMGFWQETTNKYIELSPEAGITYKFELDEIDIKYPDRTRIAIGQFHCLADNIMEDLSACKFINDNNCGTSKYKDEIISFLLKIKGEFKEGREVTAVYGCP